VCAAAWSHVGAPLVPHPWSNVLASGTLGLIATDVGVNYGVWRGGHLVVTMVSGEEVIGCQLWCLARRSSGVNYGVWRGGHWAW